MSKVLRYPKEFGTTGPSVDYLEMQFIRRNYDSEKVDYMLEDVDGANTIFINIPQKVTEAISQQFNQTKLGELGAFLGKRSDAAGAVRDALTRTAEQFLLDKSVDVANKLGATNLSASGLLSATSGVVFNPNMEVLYEGPDFRRFNFRFNLFTKSEDDAASIYAIVDTLRRASLPTANKNSVNQTALKDTFYDAAATATIIGGANAAQKGVQGLLGNLTNLLGGNKKQNTGNQGNKTNPAASALATILNNAGDPVALGAIGGLTQTGEIFNTDANQANRFITQPPFVLMTYMRGADEHPFIQPLLPAAINQIDFDFTPTGNYTTVGDFGATEKATTVGVTITMQLTEVTNLYADTLFTKRPKLSYGSK